MNKIFLIAALTGCNVVAQEKTEVVKPTPADGTLQIERRKDPQQRSLDPTTQIVTNASGAAPGAQVGSLSVDDDIRKRVLVSLSTGSIGTQGVLPANQLTDIKVAVTNRQVTLRGDVTSEKNKQSIGKRIARLDGVKGVNNLLTVNPKSKPARADLLHPDGYSSGKPNSAEQK